jgi:hypothetical protein
LIVTCGALLTADQHQFIRGDSNNDGKVDVADAIWIFYELFLGGPLTPCRAAADTNGDDSVDLSDGIYVLAYQFLGENPPPAPFPGCGPGNGVLPCPESLCP